MEKALDPLQCGIWLLVPTWEQSPDPSVFFIVLILSVFMVLVMDTFLIAVGGGEMV